MLLLSAMAFLSLKPYFTIAIKNTPLLVTVGVDSVFAHNISAFGFRIRLLIVVCSDVMSSELLELVQQVISVVQCLSVRR